MLGFLKKIFGSAQDRQVRKYFNIVKDINLAEEKLHALSDEELKAKTDEFKERIKKGETVDDLMVEAYAVVKNACRRLAGTEIHVSGYNQKWDMVPYDVQLVGGIAMHNGAIAEMHTGEGKTLTAVLPLYLNALTGKPVHLVTVNDYLASRDCQWVGTALRWLGITTGALTNDVEPEDRGKIYECDVVYGTASEFGFDYLRDNSMATSKEQQVQRGYYFTIIDEVDSILIDEARTPLIISGPVPESRQMYSELHGSVASLVKKQRDYCNKLASEAFKTLKPILAKVEQEGEKPSQSKDEQEAESEALRKLWLVGKGTPRNKILMRVKEDPDMRAALDKWDLYYYAEPNKDERKEFLSQLFLTVDERSNDYELTDKGISAWNTGTGEDHSYTDDFIMLDISDEYLKIDHDETLDEDAKVEAKLKVQEEDSLRKERAHNLRQLLRAQLMMDKDIDYIVQEGKIVIIDENTGRPQPGRRFSDGLHQAIEAKENVEIQKETQTYATITLQNFFRMYDKLSGMTGTAVTEAGEFKQIYNLDVLEIPTNKPIQRKDLNDEIYMTEREKYNAILKCVQEINEKGRPILIGTDSVQSSEKLSRVFQQNNLRHTVLNAKHHGQEAEIIASAGQNGSITIATNMAGRGTDIKLGEGVASLGGLHVIGTTRHQSRRIDRQLRGRCARQGDPGTSQFYISFEDALLRLFASPRMTSVLQRFRPPEGEPISAGILNRSIETAQKRVEQRNYTIRKHTLEYDDVMNKQRQELYSFRNEVLHSEDTTSIARDILDTVCGQAAEEYLVNRNEEDQWDPEGYREWLMRQFPVSFEEGFFDDDYAEIEELETKASNAIIEAFDHKLAHEHSKIHPPEGVADFPPPEFHTREAIRNLMIRRIDMRWQEHLLRMDHLRHDVSMRTVGQRDPLMEFKHDAFRFFDEFGRNLRNEIGNTLFRFEMVPPERLSLQDLVSTLQLERSRSMVGDMLEQQAQQQNQLPDAIAPSTQRSDSSGLAQELKAEPAIATEPKTKRNDPCPCGSGQKYKKCCGATKEDE
ncbi:MAG: preprotein translocase subunit SecA [Chlamydiota bacterium]|nr:preprotein translocase subunit SecA [Chlamydiota bacterium]